MWRLTLSCHLDKSQLRQSESAELPEPVSLSKGSRRVEQFGHVELEPCLQQPKCLIPAMFTGLYTRVVNASDRTQVLKKGTNLGKLENADIIEPKSEKPNQQKSVHSINCLPLNELH